MRRTDLTSTLTFVILLYVFIAVLANRHRTLQDFALSNTRQFGICQLYGKALGGLMQLN